MEKLKRVEKPTTLVTNEVERFDEREIGFARARRGDFGPIAASRASKSGSAVSISKTLMSALNQIGTINRIMPSVRFADGQQPEVTSMSDMLMMSERTPFPSEKAGADKGEGITDIPPGMRQIMAVMTGEPALEKTELPDNPAIISRHIKSLGYFIGADIMGICDLPKWAVYSHDMLGNPVELSHKYAICIVVDQGRRTMDASSGNDFISAAQSGRGYAMCGYIGNILASYIRMLGYPAQLHSIQGYRVLVSPLLLLSGIGELSRAGIVLNPFLGMRFKASVVTTDLPLVSDKPIDFGLQDFCNKCMKCAIECPSRSISTGEKVMRNGYENWELNSETCTRYRLGNPVGNSCGRCIKVCPWNKPEGWTHDLIRWMVRHTPFMNGLIIKMDDICGYGKVDLDKKWWFDNQ